MLAQLRMKPAERHMNPSQPRMKAAQLRMKPAQRHMNAAQLRMQPAQLRMKPAQRRMKPSQPRMKAAQLRMKPAQPRMKLKLVLAARAPGIPTQCAPGSRAHITAIPPRGARGRFPSTNQSTPASASTARFCQTVAPS